MQTISAALNADGKVVLDEAPGATLPWWSFTKTIIATIVLQASEQGKLALDARFPDHPFTWRQLLQHRSGLRDYGSLTDYKIAVNAGSAPWSVSILLDKVRYHDLAYEVGDGWLYSNVGYLLLRQGVERIYDLPLADVIRRDICAPVGVSAKLAQTPEDFEGLYWDADGYHPGWVYHGTLVGTLPDALRLLRAVLQGDLLSPQSREQMLDRCMSGPPIPGRVWSRIGYGLGLMKGEVTGIGRVLGHTGSGPFTSGLIAHFPDAPMAPFAASFCPGCDETHAEFEATRIAAQIT